MSGSNSSPPGAGAGTAPEAPAGVSFTVHSQPSPAIADDARRTRRGRWQMFGVLAVCAAPVIASYFAYYVIRPEGRTNYGELVAPKPMPATLSLRTLDGAAVAPSSLHDQWLLVVVADAACDATCETNLYLQRQLRETMGREMERMDKLWLVTDDGTPRPEVLEAIAGGHAPATVLRVPREELAQWLTPADGHTLDQHLYLVDPMGRWMLREPAEPDPAKVKRDMERLLRASASWDQPGRPGER